MKYGILGAGTHALRSHAIPGRDIPGIELVSLCDISEEQMEKFEKKYQGRLQKFTEPRSFYDTVDAILIGSPDGSHFDQLEDAVNHGKHVFVEKPLGTTIADVNKLKSVLQDAKNNGLVVSSCHPRRFDPPFMWLKKNMPKYKLGNPIEFSFDFSYHRPSKLWKHDRGLLLDHVNHEIDLLHYLFGVQSFEATRLVDKHDHYHVAGVRLDDLAFNFKGTRRLVSPSYPEWTTIRFDKGEIYMYAHRGFVRVHLHEAKAHHEIEIPPTDYDFRGRETLVNFLEAINNGIPCYLTHEDLYVNTATAVMLSENRTYSYTKSSASN